MVLAFFLVNVTEIGPISAHSAEKGTPQNARIGPVIRMIYILPNPYWIRRAETSLVIASIQYNDSQTWNETELAVKIAAVMIPVSNKFTRIADIRKYCQVSSCDRHKTFHKYKHHYALAII